jgi:hypothetical protein
MTTLLETNAIFQQPWWLDAVAPGRWSVVTHEAGDKVLARLPYVMEKRHGLTNLTMPRLTQTLGPWLSPSEAKYAKQLARQKDLMTAIIEQLPPHDYFYQRFHPSITNWLPFYWQGFEQTTRYTYALDDLGDPDRLWAGFLENVRTDIRKAERQLTVQRGLSLDRFYDLLSLTFARQGQAVPFERELLERLFAACREHHAGESFYAQDAEGNIHSAIYLVWDEKSAYYLLSGSDPERRNSGANSLLLWEAIRFASGVTRRFDFEGSMIEPIERFFRSFGAKQVPYFLVSRMSPRRRLLQAGHDLASAVKGSLRASR